MKTSTFNLSIAQSCEPGKHREQENGRPENHERRAGAFHVAIIMDGNGRWARSRRRSRSAGHVAGAAAVRRAVEAAPDLGITTLTLYAFSADNWRRPPAEVHHLMGLFQSYLHSECARCADDSVRLSVIGQRDRLPAGLRDAIEDAESRTNSGTRLHLRIAIDYSARDAIMKAAESMSGKEPYSRDMFRVELARAIHATPETGDVDLLIRTGGERRLSDFLLWESAYAELVFVQKAWPDFRAQDLGLAVREFSIRDRRFGTLPLPAPAQHGLELSAQAKVGTLQMESEAEL
jgi:undecaprenyl diphosphate synthase